ncbi:MAG: DUF4279 domain-containing protein [Leptonema sp. (in: bacteria)]
MKNFVLFLISGRDLNPEEITQNLQIKPNTVRISEYDGTVSWQLNSTLEGRKEILEHIEDILKRLYPSRKEIQNISQRFNVQLICNIDTAETQKLQIPSRYLVILGSMGVQLDIYF